MQHQARDSHATGDEPAWLFAYGSLLWRPDDGLVDFTPAILDGYQRRFWQRSSDHRGTEALPGRVVTLVPARGARVVGALYRLVDPERTLPRLDHREKQGYERRRLTVATARGAQTAIVYVADPRNPYFAGDEPAEASASVIARAHGPSGANLEYARRLVLALGELLPQLGVPAAELAYEQRVVALAEALASAR